MNVRIPGLLLSYTNGAKNVELRVAPAAPTLADALEALNERYPGMRFRVVDEQGAVRRHIKIFVDGVLARDLATPVRPEGELMIVGALTGG
jgi:sulfur-carrier protein